MKLMKYTFAVTLALSFLTFTNLCTAQKVYPQCNNLRGIEDSNGNTQLFYRIYSYSVDERYHNINYDIWRFDAAKNLDTMYLDNSESYSIVGFMDFGSIISGYQFWKNDFSKYIYSYTDYGSDIGANIRRAININCSNYAMHYPCRFYISAQNENLLYTEKGGKSVDGGMTWSADALIKGYISALSPVNDSILYFRDNANRLCKTIDRGYSAYVVDSTIAQADTFAFSLDGIHIFRTSFISNNSSQFSISSNKGEYGSWTVLDSSGTAMFLSLDDINKSVYVGYGKTVKAYDYNGNLKAENYNIKKDITGIYIKPGTDKLYVLSKYELDEYSAGAKTILKQLPVALDNADWYPLAVGNKWVYETKSYPDSVYKTTISVAGDTVMSNNLKYFKILRECPAGVSVSFQRYDTLSGEIKVYREQSESTLYKTYVDIGDTIGFETFANSFLVLANEANGSKLNLSSAERNFKTTMVLGNSIYYTMKKGIGLTSYSKAFELCGGSNDGLLACKIGSAIYGDATLLDSKEQVAKSIYSYAMEQNYPNPFNPSTCIRYSLQKAGEVKINVYSVTGKLVASLVDEYKTAGNYTVNFNAANLASGVYFCRLTSGSFVQNRKMILLK